MGTRHGLLSTENEMRWRTLLPIQDSVFGSFEYAFIKERYNGHCAKLFVLNAGEDTVVYPFFLKHLSDLPFIGLNSTAKWDSTTPEFTGPFGASKAQAGQFSESVHRLFCDLGVVSEFMHLNLWSNAHECLTDGDVFLNREVVWVDTTLSREELWRNHFSHACRKNLKRAANEKVRVVEAAGLDDIREFHRIYVGTMDRNDALSSYYFPVDYFVAIFENMRNNARFVMAVHKDQIVATTLYLHDATNVYSYLGGADYEHQQVRPTNAIVADTIDWAHRNGKRRLVLGGGYRPNDGIFRFKSSFSPLRATFYTFQRVHLPQYYEALRQDWCRYYQADIGDSGFFPAYRSRPTPNLCLAGCNE